MPTTYCMKCRQKREIKDPGQITYEERKSGNSGHLLRCGTKVFRIGKL